MKPVDLLEPVSEEITDRIPTRLRESIDRYAQYGVPTGGFLRAVLENDLFSAIALADNDSLAAIKVICTYIHNALPSTCWGSRENVKRHLQHCEALQCNETTA